MRACDSLTCTRPAGGVNSWADSGGPTYTNVQRNLALELVRVTEAAALASGKWFGKARPSVFRCVAPRQTAVCPHLGRGKYASAMQKRSLAATYSAVGMAQWWGAELIHQLLMRACTVALVRNTAPQPHHPCWRLQYATAACSGWPAAHGELP